jgi:hypothetical protein
MARQCTGLFLRDDTMSPGTSHLTKFFLTRNGFELKPDAAGVTVTQKDHPAAFTFVPWGNVLGMTGTESEPKGGNR